MNRRRMAVAGAGVALGLVVLSACGEKFTEPFRDAPRSHVVNSTPADIIEMPDGFSNWATKCDHGSRIFSAYHGDQHYAAGLVVPNDPTCR